MELVILLIYNKMWYLGNNSHDGFVSKLRANRQVVSFFAFTVYSRLAETVMRCGKLRRNLVCMRATRNTIYIE
jgi:hypothetical protein